MKSCFEEFINAGQYFFFGNHSQRSEVLMNFKAADGLYSKKKYIFRWESMLISICDCLFCVLVSFGEMFIKRPQIQSC